MPGLPMLAPKPKKMKLGLPIAVMSIGFIILILALVSIFASGNNGKYIQSFESDFVSDMLIGSATPVSQYTDSGSARSLTTSIGYSRTSLQKDGIDGTPLEVKRSATTTDGITKTKVVFKVCSKLNPKTCDFVLVTSTTDTNDTQKINDSVVFADLASAVKLL